VRRAFAWLIALPLSMAGAQFAHVVDYRVVHPDGHEREEVLRATGHGYFAYLPLIAPLLGVALVVGFVAAVAGAQRGRPVRVTGAFAFAALPLVTFGIQEHLESWVRHGSFPWDTVTAPTFLLGLLLQLPVAALTLGVTRLMLRAAEAIGRALSVPPEIVLRPSSFLSPVAVDVPGRCAFLRARPVRGPPPLPAS
jgi:hypothetical protein